MSFTCYFCNQPQPRGTKPEKVPIKIKHIFTDIVEEVIGGEDWPIKKPLFNTRSEIREEIVKEVLSCADCAKKAPEPEIEFIIGPKVKLEEEVILSGAEA